MKLADAFKALGSTPKAGAPFQPWAAWEVGAAAEEPDDKADVAERRSRHG